MSLFFISAAILIAGYFTYGALVDRLFMPDANRTTPAFAQTDGVDYVPMNWPKIFLIQLLNIAGLGPIFGALAGALWGPVAFLWIVFGCLFAGGVHDYLSGMLSMRNQGASISEITGFYLGPAMKNIMRVFSVILLVLVGTVFVTGPAKLLADLTPAALDFNFWLVVVLIYYFLATILPIDQLIGRIYPVFGLILKRLCIALPLFAVGGALSQMNFDIIWRYFAWANQTLAMIVLWACAVFLVRSNKSHWIATVPAAFMTDVSVTYLLQAPEGLHLSTALAYPAGVVVAVAVLGLFRGVIFRKNIGRPVDNNTPPTPSVPAI